MRMGANWPYLSFHKLVTVDSMPSVLFFLTFFDAKIKVANGLKTNYPLINSGL